MVVRRASALSSVGVSRQAATASRSASAGSGGGAGGGGQGAAGGAALCGGEGPGGFPSVRGAQGEQGGGDEGGDGDGDGGKPGEHRAAPSNGSGCRRYRCRNDWGVVGLRCWVRAVGDVGDPSAGADACGDGGRRDGGRTDEESIKLLGAWPVGGLLGHGGADDGTQPRG